MNEITDDGPILGSGWIPMIAFLLGFAGFAYGFYLLNVDKRLGVTVMIAAALPLAIYFYQLWRLFRALGRATLQMKDEVVPLGWSGAATYVRPLRGGATVQSIEARLQCEEYASRKSGKSRREWTKVVVDEPLSPQLAPMLEQMRVQIPLRIPAAGPATYFDADNEIRWWVRLHLKMEGCPSTRSSFKVIVVPAVVGQ